jgi:hypothetical protein
MKRREMMFEVGYLKVTVMLDPTERNRYIELVRGNEIDNLYNMSVWMDDYVNTMKNGALSWRNIRSCTSNSEEGLDHW